MTREQAERLATAFRDQFTAEVELFPEEDSPGRYSFTVISPQFQGMTALRSQDAVWEVIDRVLSRDDSVDVVMVWAFAPGEMHEWLQGLSR